MSTKSNFFDIFLIVARNSLLQIDRVTLGAQREEDASCCMNYLGLNIYSWDELTASADNPAWEIAQQKSGDDDGDIGSCLPTF